MTSIKPLRLGPAVLLLFALTGCGTVSHQPLEVHQGTEMSPRPGLFSGEDGEFVIFRR